MTCRCTRPSCGAVGSRSQSRCKGLTRCPRSLKVQDLYRISWVFIVKLPKIRVRLIPCGIKRSSLIPHKRIILGGIHLVPLLKECSYLLACWLCTDLYVLRRAVGVYQQIVNRFTAQTTDYQTLLSVFAEGLFTEMDFRCVLI